MLDAQINVIKLFEKYNCTIRALLESPLSELYFITMNTMSLKGKCISDFSEVYSESGETQFVDSWLIRVIKSIPLGSSVRPQH